ncbi:MAG TPA: transglutaminase [Lachnoclostridium sp.]|nr:transglutaminase [Lachnoclostridium sp.]
MRSQGSGKISEILIPFLLCSIIFSMKRLLTIIQILLCFFLLPAPAAFLAGCAEPAPPSALTAPEDPNVPGERDNTPHVLVPEQGGSEICGNDDVSICLSHLGDGYFSARFTGDSPKVKLQLTAENSLTYTYDLPVDGEWTIFPVSLGSGHYTLGVYSNIEATMYAEVYGTEFDVALTDEFGPFLYPNQYVWFTGDTRAIGLAKDLCFAANNDLEAVSFIYNYVITHVTYDQEEAENVQSGYLPEVDEVLDTGKGICFDYAALMASMLRTQNIPTRLEIGYAGSAYHAWISCYIKEIGWVNGIIQFDGTDWSLMDPTLASNQGDRKLKEFIGDGSNYRTVYYY